MNEENTIIRCPRCGAAIERPALPEGETLPGSPLRRCPDCDRLYFDNLYAEPALRAFEDAEVKFPYIKIIYALVPTFGAVVFLREWLGGSNSAVRMTAILFGAIAVFFDVLLLIELVKLPPKLRRRASALDRLEGRAGAAEAEMRASVERLSKKDYLDALVKCNEYVPTYFYKRIGEKPPKTFRRK